MSSSRLDVTCIPLEKIQPAQVTKWNDWLETGVEAANVFSQPELLRTIARYFDGCQLISVTKGDDLVAYLPVFRGERNDLASPIPMCDYQAVINFSSEALDFRRILRAAGIRSWRFTNARPDVWMEKSSAIFTHAISPFATLSGGFTAYLGLLKRSNSSEARFRNLNKNLRRLRKSYGPVEFIYNGGNAEAIRRLLELKWVHLGRSEPVPSNLVGLLDHLREFPEGGVRGACSVFRAGQNDVAYVYTLERKGEEFGWLYSYEGEFKKFSPGSLAMLELIKSLCNLQRKQLDFGPGGEPWKEHFATSHVAVSSGRVYANPLDALFYKAHSASRTWLHTFQKAFHW